MTEAEYLQWLRTEKVRRVVLAELAFAYESGGAPAEGRLYLANHPYRTGPSETPANRNYRDCIRSMPTFEQSIDPVTLGGSLDLRIGGSLALDNGDGAFDFLLDKIIDGREIRFYLGGEDWARADFRLVLVAFAENVSGADDGSVTITVRDSRLLLDVGVVGETIGGSDIDYGRPKPLIFGIVKNMEPRVKASATLEYWVAGNFVAGMQIYDVRDAGLSLAKSIQSVTNATLTANAGTDTMTLTSHGLAADDVIRFFDDPVFPYVAASSIFAGLTGGTQYWVIAAGLTANDFRVSLTKGGSAVDITGTTFSGTVWIRATRFYDNVAVDGTMKLSSSPAGRVTLDVDAQTQPCTLKNLIQTYGNVENSMIDAAGFDTLEGTTQPVKGGSGRAVSGLVVRERTNLRELLDRLAESYWSWYGPTELATVTGGIIDPPAIELATPDHYLVEDDIHEKGITVANQAPTISSAVALVSKNWSVQTDGLAAAVTADEKARYGQEYQDWGPSTSPSGTTYTTNWQAYHLTAVPGDPFETLANIEFDDSTNFPQNMADAFLEDRVPHRRVVSVPANLTTLTWRIGKTVNMTYPRYGFESGRNARIIGRAVDILNDEVRLSMILQKRPDVATADHV